MPDALYFKVTTQTPFEHYPGDWRLMRMGEIVKVRMTEHYLVYATNNWWGGVELTQPAFQLLSPATETEFEAQETAQL